MVGPALCVPWAAPAATFQVDTSPPADSFVGPVFRGGLGCRQPRPLRRIGIDGVSFGRRNVVGSMSPGRTRCVFDFSLGAPKKSVRCSGKNAKVGKSVNYFGFSRARKNVTDQKPEKRTLDKKSQKP